VLIGDDFQWKDDLYAFGYPDRDFENGEPVWLHCEGNTGDDPPLIKFKLGKLRPGMSGSPVLNGRTGKVCGMVKFTLDRHTITGGGGVAASVILSHLKELETLQQQFHETDRRWTELLPEAGTPFAGSPPPEPIDRTDLPNPCNWLPDRHRTPYRSLENGFVNKVREMWTVHDILQRRQTAIVEGMGGISLVVGMGGAGQDPACHRVRPPVRHVLSWWYFLDRRENRHSGCRCSGEPGGTRHGGR
jgi:hypothetical protein